jgi:hypothetical protein
MARHARVEEVENGYTCNMGSDGEYPSETHIAENMDEVHEHLKKHFSGKEKKEKKEKSSDKLMKLARH